MKERFAQTFHNAALAAGFESELIYFDDRWAIAVRTPGDTEAKFLSDEPSEQEKADIKSRFQEGMGKELSEYEVRSAALAVMIEHATAAASRDD